MTTTMSESVVVRLIPEETYRQPNPGPYRIRCRDGFAAAIERDGYTVLILAEGAERNEREVDAIVRALNDQAIV